MPVGVELAYKCEIFPVIMDPHMCNSYPFLMKSLDLVIMTFRRKINDRSVLSLEFILSHCAYSLQNVVK